VGSNPTARAKLNKVANFKEYINETVTEMVHKVTWPTWKELQSSTILVVVASVIFALSIALMDYVFGAHDVADPNTLWKGFLGSFYNMFK
jgi:preprotein translocase subunit SecE